MKLIWTKGISSLGLSLWLTVTLVCLWLVGWQLLSVAAFPAVSAYAAEPSSSPAESSAGLLEPSATITICSNTVAYIATSTPWTSGNTYLANNCSIVVNAGVTLTIQAGVTVMFTGTASALIINGTLLAESANASQPITFTSLAAVKSPGQWFGLHFASGSRGRLNNVFIGYAASGDLNGYGAGWNVAQVHVVSADVQMRNSLVTAGRITRNWINAGIYFEGAGLSPVLDTVQVSNNTSGNPVYPAYAIYQATVNMTPTFRSLVLTGNDTNAVTVYWGNEGIAQNVTLGGSSAPYRFDCHHTGCGQYIPSGKTLTINPGTELQYDYHAYRIIVQSGGALVAEGTAAQPITFTSGMTTPAAGNWQGLQVEANGSAHLAYVDLGYAGGYYKNLPALDAAATDVQVRHVVFHDNGSDGVRINGPNVAPVFEDVSVLNSGGYGVLMADAFGPLGKPTWDGGVISGSGKTGIYLGYYNASAVQPTFRNLIVANNHGDGVWIARNGPVPTFENVAITGNTGAAVTQNPDSSPVYRNLTMSGNETNAVVIPGDSLGGGRYWGSGQPELPFLVQGSVTIPAGTFLSLEPGMTMRFYTDTALYASGGGALYALGTPDRPITFTGLIETPGFWRGIDIGGTSQAILRNCDIGYAGRGWNGKSLNMWSYGFSVVQNCRIHHSSYAGVYADYHGSPVFTNNQVYSATWGAIKGFGPDGGWLDVRNNWWGDASGPYHATANPTGKGVSVTDYVLFSPWLTAPPTQTTTTGQFIINTGGPRFVSPGQTVDYSIQYINMMTQTVTNAVLVLQLPLAAEYVDSTGGGSHWTDRDQVFWKLGNLAPGANGFVSARVRFQWGLPANYTDGTLAFLAGSDYNAANYNIAPYLQHDEALATGQSVLSEVAFAADRAANADLQAFYSSATAAGYAYARAYRMAFDDGKIVDAAVLVRNDNKAVKVLTLAVAENRAFATTYEKNLVTVQGAEGTITTDLVTGQQTLGGAYALPAGGLLAASPAACTENRCRGNCLAKVVSLKVVTAFAMGYGSWLLTYGWAGPAGLIGVTLGAGLLTWNVLQCYYDCGDPSTHCCNAGEIRWTSPGILRLTNQCARQECTAVGAWASPVPVQCAVSGQRCVAGKGCVDCKEEIGLAAAQSPAVCSAVGAGGKPSCRSLELLRAKDPNALYGPSGDLLPGQLMTYTITYENEGAGSAYGVYVTNELPDVFDFDSARVYTTTGIVLSNTRELVFPVGQLAPKGQVGSTGLVTYTVRLKSGLAGGTVVTNRATVYFPSVPEETPTNMLVNVIQTVAAASQELQTNYGQPVSITLSGIEVSGLPLTFTVTQDPLNGILGGLAPTLVYTPAANFTGLDRFAFRASNGITESRPADVQIQVNPAGDATPPQVQWTEPASGAISVSVQTTPAYVDTVGPVYPPFITVGFSEAISSATVSTQTVQVVDSAGRVLARAVEYDGGLRRVVVIPREPLRGETVYTVTVTTGVRDLAGNALAANYVWGFRTAAPPMRYVYLPLVMKNR